MVLRRHMGEPWEKNFLTAAVQALSILIALLPHAATTQQCSLKASNRANAFRGPLGSSDSANSFGWVARSANTFTTVNPPKPQSLANATHFLIVASSILPSALLGFNITHSNLGLLKSQTRTRLYR